MTQYGSNVLVRRFIIDAPSSEENNTDYPQNLYNDVNGIRRLFGLVKFTEPEMALPRNMSTIVTSQTEGATINPIKTTFLIDHLDGRGDSTNNIYFTDDGDIIIADKTKIDNVYKYISDVPFYFRSPLKPQLFINNRDYPTEIKPKIIEANKVTNQSGSAGVILVYSKPLGRFVLYKQDAGNKLVLFYNPATSNVFSDLIRDSETRSTVEGQLGNYCSSRNISAKDPICNCLNVIGVNDQQFCMADLLGGDARRQAIQNSSPESYGTIANNCPCFNLNCPISHPYKKDYQDLLSGGRCPDNEITLCNVTLSAGRDVNLKDFDVEQKCGGSIDRDCKLTDWGPCVEGVRKREIVIEPVGRGEKCGPLEESCLPVDCEVGPWTTDCSGGFRTRQIIKPAAFGGKACPSLKESCSSKAWIIYLLLIVIIGSVVFYIRKKRSKI